MKTLDHYAGGHDNNFNLLRMIAAAAVIYSHAFPFVQGYLTVAGGSYPNWTGDWLWDLTGALDSGRMAVLVFFVMSGYLVVQSLVRRGSLRDYFLARGLRILPGLWVAVLITAFVIGLAMTTLPVKEYLTHRALYKFLAYNLGLFNGWEQDLPGVFKDNPEGGRANNSLWTLTWEVLMYLALGAFFLLGFLRRRVLLLVLTAAIYLAFVLNREFHWVLHPYPLVFGAFFSYFFTGSLLWLYRDRVPLNGATTAAAVLLLALDLYGYRDFMLARLLSPALVAYTVIALALVPAGLVRAYNRIGDYSYGTYIYAFPIEQSLVILVPGLMPLQLFAATFVVTVPVAMASWYLIEKPALRLKPGRRPSQR